MKRNSFTIILIIFIILTVILISILGYRIYKERDILFKKNSENVAAENYEENKIEEEKPIKIEEKKEISIFNGEDRTIAVMIDNHKGAWPQAGLNQTFLVYEIIAEGGETRLMALFKGQNVETIGPVRSSRHYFLDYVMENDAIYAHYGWSPKAKSDISTYSINNINGLYYGKPTFWRISNKKSPHNAMTSSKEIIEKAEKLKYRTTSNVASVFKYSTEEINLEDGEEATEITIPHSYMQTVTYKYDEDSKRYTRYARGVLQKDYNTGESITTKNIIITFADNSVLKDGTNKDRQELDNIGVFDGYYITNGKAIKIKCTKKSRTTQTEYTYLSGEKIEVNDGNTWINICPTKAKVEIE